MDGSFKSVSFMNDPKVKMHQTVKRVIHNVGNPDGCNI